MHIVYISREFVPTQRGGGIASYVKDMASAMVARGHQITVICASDDTRTTSDKMENGIRIIRLKGGDFIIPSVETSWFTSIKKLRIIYRFFSYRKRILETIKNLENIDIIEVADFGAEGYYLWRQDIPVVVRMHTPSIFDRTNLGVKRYPISKFYLEWSAKKEIETLIHFAHFNSCSYSLQAWYNLYFPQVKGDWKVIYNPLDTSQWNKSKAHNSYLQNSILYVGTVMEEKGVGDLVKACAILREEGYPITLTIAGKMGSYALQLKAETEDNNYTWCKFTGNLPRAELDNLYRSSKISCFPSHWENLPFVCLEAMAAGNVVIGSKSGGMSEMITDGKDGWLVQPKDINNIKDMLLKALQMTDDEVEKMRTMAHKTIDVKFSANHILPMMEHYYQQICKQTKDK